MSGDLDEREVTISGVKVVFPCKPYPSQFGMMDKVIKGLERRQNCLLESPTGSGKSLALLCSALAWQNAQHLKAAKDAMTSTSSGKTEDGKPCECNQTCQQNGLQETKPEPVSGPSKESVIMEDGDDSDDDFRIPSKHRTPSIPQNKNKKRSHVSISYDDDGSSPKESPTCDQCTCDKDAPAASSKQKVPKIYFGTRTHKQIAQIVRELRKTAYHDVRMVVLASREYTCVHPDVTRLNNKSEGCRERLDVHGPGCSFNDRAKRVFLSQGQLQSELNSAWDLEELVHACKVKKACPYFVTRNIKDQADIIFCPYNYLIDPLVRKSMEIHLKDQIVILDEAHNMEDCAREAASGQITTSQINQTILKLQELMDANVKFSDHLTLKRMMENVGRFVDENSGHLDQADYDTSFKVWSGFDMVARLKNIGLGPDTLDEYKACLDRIMAGDEDQQQQQNIFGRKNRNIEIKLHSSSVKILEQLLQILDYMYRNELKYVEDYRVAIMKTVEYVSRNTNDSWLGKNRRGRTREEVFTVNFWCMNPAVAFSDFDPCRNVVLSSGTLSPMTSFASELGVPFPVHLEANHVIKDEQVWVGSIGCGPSGSQLQAVYKNMETFTFQDELGSFILEVCKKVPHGVLCFLPSYRALEKFTDRWKLTRVWENISKRKKIMVEPRAADREDFDQMMKVFYEVIKDPTHCYNMEDESIDVSDRDGAIFFAVCRGKVSEGMDFTDNNARAVITVGIPFPSIKDLQVKLKREYNDRYRVERGLLSGNEWYEIQAFRALNQALGRCIRHRKDWGAIILVDDRFVRMAGKYCKGLSKWVRNKVHTFEMFPRFLDSLSSFTNKMIKEMPVVNPDTSFIPCTPSTPAARRKSVYNQATPPTPATFASPTFSQKSPVFRSPPSQQSTSPYFTTQDGSSPKMFGTPTSSTKSKTATNIVINKSVVPPQPSMQTILASSVPGVPLYTQLVNIMNSPNIPKDKPYCIILDKGSPSEQMFNVDPSKTGAPSSPRASSSGAATLPNSCTQKPDAVIPTVLASTLPGVPFNTQLMNIMSLPSVPKDKPYYVVFNKGEADEQMFHVDPEKRGQSTTNGSNCPLPPSTETPKQQVPEPIQSTKKSLRTFTATSVPWQPLQDQLKQILNSPSLPKDEPYYILLNKGSPNEQILLIEPNKNGKLSDQSNVSKTTSAPIDVPLTVTSLANQTLNPDSSTEKAAGSSIPSIVNDVANPKAALGEDPLIGSKRSDNGLRLASASSIPVNGGIKETLKPEISMGTVATVNNSVVVKEESNKFLKFCNLPKPAVSSDVEQKNLQKGNDQMTERTESPVIFDSGPDEQTVISTSQTDYANVEEPLDSACKRKPIFRKEIKVSETDVCSKAEKMIKVEQVEGSETVNEKSGVQIKTELGEENTTDKKIKLENHVEDTVNLNDWKVEKVKVEKTQNVPVSRRTSRGKFDKSVIDRLKTTRRKSTADSEKDAEESASDGQGKTVLKDITSEKTKLVENQNLLEMENQSDEEFLCTRRKTGRKRSSMGTSRNANKRQKGIHYENNIVSTKENKGHLPSEWITCLKCGNKLLKSEAFQLQEDSPKFIQSLSHQKLDHVLHGDILDLSETSLECIKIGTDKGHLSLDSRYLPEARCCVQYLQCKQCTGENQSLIGALVIMTETQSDFHVGQVWVIPSTVKTQGRPS